MLFLRRSKNVTCQICYFLKDLFIFLSFFFSFKQRKPAWCDRILWKIKSDPENLVNFEAKQLSYSSFPLMKMSDHKPVSAEFEVQVSTIIFIHAVLKLLQPQT
jgi:hypothetical protein